MATQQEQLKEAKRAYIVPLNANWTRFQVYLDNANGAALQVLWPGDSQLGKKTKELIGNQLYSIRKGYPAFHWWLTGWGYSKELKVAIALCHVNPKLEVYSGFGYGGQLKPEHLQGQTL